MSRSSSRSPRRPDGRSRPRATCPASGAAAGRRWRRRCAAAIRNIPGPTIRPPQIRPCEQKKQWRVQERRPIRAEAMAKLLILAALAAAAAPALAQDEPPPRPRANRRSRSSARIPARSRPTTRSSSATAAPRRSATASRRRCATARTAPSRPGARAPKPWTKSRARFCRTAARSSAATARADASRRSSTNGTRPAAPAASGLSIFKSGDARRLGKCGNRDFWSMSDPIERIGSSRSSRAFPGWRTGNAPAGDCAQNPSRFRDATKSASPINARRVLAG